MPKRKRPTIKGPCYKCGKLVAWWKITCDKGSNKFYKMYHCFDHKAIDMTDWDSIFEEMGYDKK